MIPQIGDWFKKKDVAQRFEIVAVDEDDGTLELQYEDGTVEEWEMEEWEAYDEDGELERAFDPHEDDEESDEDIMDGEDEE